MSEKAGAAAAAENAASTSSQLSAGNAASDTKPATAPKKAAPGGNPAFRMMGLPRLRLPSRNWLIFLSITGSFASAIFYDKYQTRRVREKWCHVVSHIAKENLDSHQMPRKLTVYLAAPPGDGLRSAREHFHNYVKPVLVAAAMDWDVVEGRKEGDVRYKTAERIRKKRRKEGEGKMNEDEQEGLTVDAIRQKNGTRDFDGVGGDIIVGRHTWKEYIRGLHEGWLGPVDPPTLTESETSPGQTPNTPLEQPPLQSAAEKAAGDYAKGDIANAESGGLSIGDTSTDAAPASGEEPADEKKADEKPKPRQPPPYILPEEYSTAHVSSQISEIVGPSTGVRFPHLLGFRNTPIRIYRFLNRRQLADSVGRDVAAAVLASHRSYNTLAEAGSPDGTFASTANDTELKNVLKHEERDWWKTTYQPRKEHEESVWIEDIVLDDRVACRLRAFELTAEDEARAKKIGQPGIQSPKIGEES